MKYLSLSFLVLIGLNLVLWQGVLVRTTESTLEVYFLDVGQGDSQLILFPDGTKFLIDGGPDKSVLFELDEVLSLTDRYIDLIFISHPQLDHYGGIKDVLERYEVGALVVNGQEGRGEAWDEFKDTVLESGVSVVSASQGDRILYKDSVIDILWPAKDLVVNRDPNESSLVMELIAEGVELMLTGDIGFDTEEMLVELYDLDTDVLKVAHHGSRYSSSLEFLEEATPAISVIEVGDNTFGHPTADTLQRLARVESSVYRTDQDGRIKLLIENGKVGVVSR